MYYIYCEFLDLFVIIIIIIMVVSVNVMKFCV